MTAWKSGMLLTAARLLDDTPTTTTSGLTAATNFSVNDFLGMRVGNLIVIDAYVQYTGAGITATNGNIADTEICTLPSGWRPAEHVVDVSWDDGFEDGGLLIDTDGTCDLRTSSDTIATGANIRFHAAFIVDD